MLCRTAFNLPINTTEPYGQQLSEVPACTIWPEETKVMDMTISLKMSIPDFLGIYFVEPVALGKDFPDVVVQTVYTLLGICIFLYMPVLFAQIITEHIDCCTDECIHLPGTASFFTVKDICLCRLGMTVFNENFFNYILDLFYAWNLILVAKRSDLYNLIGEFL